MTPKKILHLSQLTPHWHASFLEKLKTSLFEWSATYQDSLDGKLSTDFFIRDWWLIQEGKDSIIQVFLDTKNPEGMTAEDCLRIHRWFMDKDVFNNFGDDFSIEVSSSGAEPPLRDVSHFEEARGKEIFLQTWQKENDRLRYIMILDDVFMRDNQHFVRLKEGECVFDVAISQIRWAYIRYQAPEKHRSKKSKKR